MIKVNWSKIKPFEKKSFALSAIAILALLFVVFAAIGFVIAKQIFILKLLCAIFLTVVFGYFVHIESRMIQIYLLQALLDVLTILFAVLPSGKGVCVFLFIISILLIIATIIGALVVKKQLNTGTKYKCKEPDRSNIFKNKNVMMFAPHEDDEINIYGGVIEQYVKYGSTVRVVFSTNGDCYGLGKLRIKEAMDVAKSYGIPDDNFIFLGYSDSLNNADGKHIYNAGDEEIVTSVKGYTSTYGSDKKPCYKSNDFTRANILSDFTSVINEYKPDVIYCCDYDSHQDHRAIGLFFEEALGNILKEDKTYHPEVYKGFAYSLAWMGKLDYYSLNSLSTHQWIEDEFMVENNIYKWDDRLRLPVATENLSHIMQNASSYVAMMKYSSQTATDHANGILNNDKTFWYRRTDSVLYDAKIKSTSGNASRLTEFKLCDSTDIKNQDLMPMSNVWTASDNDENRIVIIKLPQPKSISEIVIYGSPLGENHILNASIKIGSHHFETGEFKPCGAANHFMFNPIKTSVIAIKVNDFVSKCQILKVEAFEKQDDTKVKLLKIVNNNDDFCYDYVLDETGTEDFTIYSYPKCDNIDLDITSAGVETKYENGILNVKCKEGRHGIVRVSLKDNPTIYDEVRFNNLPIKERRALHSKQMLEQRYWTLPMQKDYYVGLIRRLNVYK